MGEIYNVLWGPEWRATELRWPREKMRGLIGAKITLVVKSGAWDPTG